MQKIRKLYADSIMELKVTKNMVICAFMAALAVVLSYTTSIEVGPYIRIGFSGLPNRIVEFLFGPITGCIFGGALDVLKHHHSLPVHSSLALPLMPCSPALYMFHSL